MCAHDGKWYDGIVVYGLPSAPLQQGKCPAVMVFIVLCSARQVREPGGWLTHPMAWYVARNVRTQSLTPHKPAWQLPKFSECIFELLLSPVGAYFMLYFG